MVLSYFTECLSLLLFSNSYSYVSRIFTSCSFALFFFLFCKYNQKNNLVDFNLKSFKFDKYFLRFIISLVFVCILELFVKNGLFNIFSFDAWSKIKPGILKEYDFFAIKLKSTGLFFIQMIYYFFEFSLTICLTAVSQEFGEYLFKDKKNWPWGGIGLCLTWGLIHIFTQGLTDGLGIILVSFVLGWLYKFCGKNPIFLFIFLAGVFFV